MPSRYDNTQKIINNSDLYYEVLESKKRNFIEQYPTQVIKPVTDTVKINVLKEQYVWASGDKFHSLSAKYYDDTRYWWIIAWFNQKPTEQHIKIGETIYIPLPLNKVLSYYYGG